jgi:hypothetical protein
MIIRLVRGFGMKILLTSLMIMVSFALLLSVMQVFGAEGTKVLRFADTSITVPEMAPEFTAPGWSAAMVGEETFPNGRAMMVVVIGPDSRVRVIVLLIKHAVSARLSVVAFCAEYPGKPMEYFEDVQYATTGKPSGVFSRCEGAKMDRYSRWLKGTGI